IAVVAPLQQLRSTHGHRGASIDWIAIQFFVSSTNRLPSRSVSPHVDNSNFALGGQAHETHSPLSRGVFTFSQLFRADAARNARAHTASLDQQNVRTDVADPARDSLQQWRCLHRTTRRCYGSRR